MAAVAEPYSPLILQRSELQRAHSMEQEASAQRDGQHITELSELGREAIASVAQLECERKELLTALADLEVWLLQGIKCIDMVTCTYPIELLTALADLEVCLLEVIKCMDMMARTYPIAHIVHVSHSVHASYSP